MGFIAKAEPIVLQLYSETLQKFRLAAQGHGAVQPPEQHRERVATYFDPLPIWYEPFEESQALDAALPAARGHAAADVHVPRLGFAERLAAADPPRATACTSSAPPAARSASPTRTGSWITCTTAASRCRCG